MAFVAIQRAVVLLTTLLAIWPTVRRAAVLVITTAVRMLTVIFLAGVLVLIQQSPYNAAEPDHAGVVQMAFVTQCVLEQLIDSCVCLAVGWSSLFCRTIGSIARNVAAFGTAVLLQLSGTLLARGKGYTQAAGQSSWPGRPPGSAEHATAPDSAPVTVGATAGWLAACCKLVLHRSSGHALVASNGRASSMCDVPVSGDCASAARSDRQLFTIVVTVPRAAKMQLRQAAATGRRRGLAIIILVAGVALAACLLGGVSTQMEGGAITVSLGRVPKRSNWPRGPERDGTGSVGRGCDSSRRWWRFLHPIGDVQACCPTHPEVLGETTGAADLEAPPQVEPEGRNGGLKLASVFAFASDSTARGCDFCTSTCTCAGASGPGACAGTSANFTTVSLTSVLPGRLSASRPRWRLTGGTRDDNRGLWLRSGQLPSALVPFQPAAHASLPTLFTDALNLLAMCACIANQAAISAAEVEAVSAWCRWQPPRPLLDRVRTAGVGSRAPLAMSHESACAAERRFLMAQAQQRLSACCALQLVFISFSLTPLLFARLFLLNLQLTCEAYYTLLLTYAILAAAMLCCMLCSLTVLRSVVGNVLRLVPWARRGLLTSARELTVGSPRELTWPEVLGGWC